MLIRKKRYENGHGEHKKIFGNFTSNFLCIQTEGDAEAEEKKDEEKAEENGTNGDQAADEKSSSTNGDGGEGKFI